VVSEGDTLGGIAHSIYGDATLWRLLAEANDIDNPLSLRPGQQLIVQPLSSL
jgi:nucleoid-associated protein YgaU